MSNDLPKIIVISGTNASGKSALGIELAQKYNGEIISADSRQVFKNFDLCCGKVTEEEMNIVPHHLINVCNVGDNYSVSDFQKGVYKTIPKIINRGKTPFIVGGTGLYISSIVYGYDFQEEIIDVEFRKSLETKSIEELIEMLPLATLESLKSNNSEINNKRRIIRILEKINNNHETAPNNKPKYNALQIGVTWPKDILHKRIDERLSLRIKQGMIDEVRQYIDAGFNPQYLYNLGLEYRYILWYVTGKYASFDDFYEDMSRAIKKFAKRQMTWFKRDKSIHWIDMTNDALNEASDIIECFLDK